MLGWISPCIQMLQKCKDFLSISAQSTVMLNTLSFTSVVKCTRECLNSSVNMSHLVTSTSDGASLVRRPRDLNCARRVGSVVSWRLRRCTRCVKESRDAPDVCRRRWERRGVTRLTSEAGSEADDDEEEQVENAGDAGADPSLVVGGGMCNRERVRSQTGDSWKSLQRTKKTWQFNAYTILLSRKTLECEGLRAVYFYPILYKNLVTSGKGVGHDWFQNGRHSTQLTVTFACDEYVLISRHQKPVEWKAMDESVFHFLNKNQSLIPECCLPHSDVVRESQVYVWDLLPVVILKLRENIY